MSKMVSARIPDAVYDQACAQLTELGSCPTELINAAFEYVLQERRIPKSKAAPKAQRRKLSEGDRARLQQMLAACTLDTSIPSDVAHDKMTIAKAKAAKYEALA